MKDKLFISNEQLVLLLQIFTFPYFLIDIVSLQYSIQNLREIIHQEFHMLFSLRT